MGFEEHAIRSLQNNRALMRRSSHFTEAHTKRIKRKKEGKHERLNRNPNSYALTKARKDFAFKRDAKLAVIVLILLGLCSYGIYLYLS